MRDSEFEFIRTLVYARSRIRLGPEKRELVAARLGRRLRESGLPSLGAYCRLLQTPDGEAESVQLIEALSTHHTAFFRENEHFEFARTTVIPELLERAPAERGPRFHAWSAGCSSGEEAYSLAIVLAEGLEGRGWPWQIEATDISERVIAQGRAGIYRAAALAPISPARCQARFQRGIGPQEGNFRVQPALRDAVRFRTLNLLGGLLPFADPFHLILCRNVMIYFDRTTQEELVGRLTRALVPGGYLFVGHAESLTGIRHSLEVVKPAVYRRPLA